MSTALIHKIGAPRMTKLFIFDLDGVLVDACDWHRDALNEALQEVCNYVISEEEHVSTFNGIPTKEKLKILSQRGIVDESLHSQINDLKQEKTISIIEKNANIRQEKIDLIDELKRNNHHVACYTNSIRRTAKLMLQKTGILDKFDFVLTNQDVKAPKPAPDGYLQVMEKFGVASENCYIIEDSPKGLKAAYASGANVIEVKNADEVDLNLIRRYL